MDATTITFTVNGQQRTVTTDGTRPLLEVLREDLHLTGTKYGCGEGKCAACTVLVDGQRTYSCKTEVGRRDTLQGGQGKERVRTVGCAAAARVVPGARGNGQHLRPRVLHG